MSSPASTGEMTTANSAHPTPDRPRLLAITPTMIARKIRTIETRSVTFGAPRAVYKARQEAAGNQACNVVQLILQETLAGS